MELKDFIKKVLEDLVEAVEETRESSVRDLRLSNSEGSRTVEFDIAISAEESSGSNGKAGVRVLEFVQVGGDLSELTRNSTVSRIRFGVNINYLTKNEEADRNSSMRDYMNRGSSDYS